MKYPRHNQKKKLVQSRCDAEKVEALKKANINLSALVKLAVDRAYSDLMKSKYEKERWLKNG